MDMKYKLQEVGMSKVRRVYVEKKPEFAVKANMRFQVILESKQLQMSEY